MYRLTVIVNLPDGGLATFRFHGRFKDDMWAAYYAHRARDPYFNSIADTGRFATDYVDTKTGKVESVA